MSVGTATAIALASSAAASAYSAHAQASGAKKAAATQAAATDKATALQAQMANQAINAQNNIMYGGNGGTGGSGMPGQGGGPQGYGGGGIAGMYAPYTNSAPATLSALHAYLGIPGAQQSQTMVPYNAYGPSMRPPLMGQPQLPQGGGYQGAPNVPMPPPTTMAPTGQPFLPRVGPGQQPIQARAWGGPVEPGQQYLVGEKGPELFSPQQPGNINSNEDTKRQMYRQQQGQVVGNAATAGGGMGRWGTPNGIQTTPWGQSSGSGWISPVAANQWGPQTMNQSVGGNIGQMLQQGPTGGSWSAPGYVPPQPWQPGGIVSGYDPGTGPRNPMAMNQDDAATLAGLYQDYQSRRGPRV